MNSMTSTSEDNIIHPTKDPDLIKYTIIYKLTNDVILYLGTIPVNIKCMSHFIKISTNIDGSWQRQTVINHGTITRHNSITLNS